jgi:hypothetical protein
MLPPGITPRMLPPQDPRSSAPVPVPVVPANLPPFPQGWQEHLLPLSPAIEQRSHDIRPSLTIGQSSTEQTGSEWVTYQHVETPDPGGSGTMLDEVHVFVPVDPTIPTSLLGNFPTGWAPYQNASQDAPVWQRSQVLKPALVLGQYWIEQSAGGPTAYHHTTATAQPGAPEIIRVYRPVQLANAGLHIVRQPFQGVNFVPLGHA